MDKENKNRILLKAGLALLGVIGLVAAFFLARTISTINNPIINNGSNIAFEAVTDDFYPDETEPPVIDVENILIKPIDDFTNPEETTMTEEQINEMLSAARMEGESAALVQDSEPAEEVVATDTRVNHNTSIDFNAIWEINEDVYAWIIVPGTNIHHPILQHASDHGYYLNYNIDGTYGYPGCIYTENLNTKTFDDPNTLIYGHNMKNGTMFAPLHKFREKDFFDTHREVIIHMPDKTLTYEIFAAYIYDDRHIMYSFDFSKSDVFEKYLQSIFDIRDMSANINRDITVTKDDKIITLATCIAGRPENRLLVQAVRR